LAHGKYQAAGRGLPEQAGLGPKGMAPGVGWQPFAGVTSLWVCGRHRHSGPVYHVTN